MSEKPKEKIEDMKKVAGGADSGSGIDHGSGQDPSTDPPQRGPDLGTTDTGFGTTEKKTAK